MSIPSESIQRVLLELEEQETSNSEKDGDLEISHIQHQTKKVSFRGRKSEKNITHLPGAKIE